MLFVSFVVKKLKVFKGQSGFSLMEVMFAVVILSLGLVFVACQFPVGIDAVRDVVDETNKIIDAHNSQVMLELEFQRLKTLPNYDPKLIWDNRENNYNPPPSGYPTTDVMTMHVLAKPNVLADSLLLYNNKWRVVIDDPEYYEAYITGAPLNTFPLWPFWSHNSIYAGAYQNFTDAFIGFIGDIGNIMSPPVDESDPQVVGLLPTSGYDPTYINDRIKYLHPAIFEESLKRNYSWAAMYHENSNEYYIFTLRHPKKQVRYAVQHPDSFRIFQEKPRDPYGPIKFSVEPLIAPTNGTWPSMIYPEPYVPTPSDPPVLQDRMFPIPWRVCLGEYSQRYRVSSGGSFYYEDKWAGPDSFRIPEEIAHILRTGSIIVDADPADNDSDTIGPLTTRGSGQIYEVSEIFLDDANQYWMRLRTDLYDDLHYFWVFPPPIKRGVDNALGYEFEDTQPVVEVTKKIINF